MSIINFDDIIKQELGNDDVLHFTQNEKHLPQHPFHMCISAGTGKGKSNLVWNLLFNPNCALNYHKVYIYAKDLHEDKYIFLENRFRAAEAQTDGDILEMSSDINDVVNPDDLDRNKMNLVIIDDMVTEKSSDKVKELYIRGRKANCSTIYLTQKFFAVPNLIRSNLNYIAMLESPNDGRMLQSLAIDLCGIDKKKLKQLYMDCMKEPFNFMFFDFKTNDKRLRFRSGFTGLLKDSFDLS